MRIRIHPGGANLILRTLPILISAVLFISPRVFADWRAEDVIAMAKTAKLTLPQLITNLPPELGDRFLLSLASRSTQKGTPLYPRAMLFNENFVMTYAGHPESRGNTIEMIQFNWEAKNFDFYHLVFDGNEVHVEKNPNNCKACHRASLRPIWPTRMMMPWFSGFYGIGHANFSDTENEHLNAFVAQNKDNPLYQRLISQITSSIQEPSLQVQRHNETFDDLLDNQMTEFAAFKIARLPKFKEFAGPLLAVLASRVIFYVDGPREKYDIARELSAYFPESASAIEAEIQRRAQPLFESLQRYKRDKWIRHEQALNVRISPTGMGIDYLDVIARYLAALELVFDRMGEPEFLDQAILLGFKKQEVDLLGVNINPWFFPGKLERRLLTIASEMVGQDIAPHRKIAVEDFEPPMSFPVWKSFEDARTALRELHGRLNCETALDHSKMATQ